MEELHCGKRRPSQVLPYAVADFSALQPGAKDRQGDFRGFGGVFSRSKSAVHLCRQSDGKPVRIISCYEAGFDAHWLHRWLTDQGVTNYEIDPASVAVNRRARRVKTDRIDLDQLLRTLLAYLRDEPRVCSMVHVPAVEDEDRKRLNREREYLKGEQTAHTNRIKGLLHAQGVRNQCRLGEDLSR